MKFAQNEISKDERKYCWTINWPKNLSPNHKIILKCFRSWNPKIIYEINVLHQRVPKPLMPELCYSQTSILPQKNEIEKFPLDSNFFSVFRDGFCLLYHSFHFNWRLGWFADLSWVFKFHDLHYLGLFLCLVFPRWCPYWPRPCSFFLYPWCWRYFFCLRSRTKEKCKISPPIFKNFVLNQILSEKVLNFWPN